MECAAHLGRSSYCPSDEFRMKPNSSFEHCSLLLHRACSKCTLIRALSCALSHNAKRKHNMFAARSSEPSILSLSLFEILGEHTNSSRYLYFNIFLYFLISTYFNYKVNWQIFASNEQLQHEHVVTHKTYVCALSLSPADTRRLCWVRWEPTPICLPLPLSASNMEHVRGLFNRLHLLGAALVACETRMREHREKEARKKRIRKSRVKRKFTWIITTLLPHTKSRAPPFPLVLRVCVK